MVGVSGGEFFEQTFDAVGGFVENPGPGHVFETVEFPPALARFVGEIADEVEFGGRQTAGGKSRDQGTRARDGLDAETGGARGAHDTFARVANAGAAGIGNERDALALAQAFEDFTGSARFVEAEVTQERFVKLEMLEQSGGVAGVFGGDDVTLFEGAQGAERDVLEIANRGGHEVKRSGDQRRWFGRAHSEFQSGGWLVLKSGFDLDVLGADVLEALADGAMGQFRPIAVAAQVSQVDVAQVRGHDLLGHGGGGLIGEVAMTAEDALFHTPGPASVILQEFEVVIGLEHEDPGRPDSLDDKFGGMPEIGEKPDVPGGRVDEKADRVISVVGYRKGVDGDIANLERRAGEEDTAFEAGPELAFDGFLGQAIAENRDL